MSGDRGAGLFGTVFGVAIFLILMLVSVQVLTHLYATSVVEAAAYDAVQAVSGSSGGDVAGAEAHARSLLGALSDSTTFEWSVDEDQTVLRVTAQRTQLVPAPIGTRLGIDTIDREFRMRTERFR